MARAISPAQMDRLRRRNTPSELMQPIFADNGQISSLRPVPSLAALEQEGGPEADGRLELPTREPWSTRMSSELFDD